MGVGALQPDVEKLPSTEDAERRPLKPVDGGATNSMSALVLQPINANVSFRDQAYAALKQAIMEADIYAHDDELRLDERQLVSDILYTKNQRLGAVEDQASARVRLSNVYFYFLRLHISNTL